MLYNRELSSRILSCAIAVHRELGPGMLESTYEACLCHELHLAELAFRRQVECPLLYKGIHLDCGYRLDIVVEDTMIVEVKAVERILPAHQAQLMAYLRIYRKTIGFLINFNVVRLKDGICRRVL
jgi:GxxExxY protein